MSQLMVLFTAVTSVCLAVRFAPFGIKIFHIHCVIAIKHTAEITGHTL